MTKNQIISKGSVLKNIKNILELMYPKIPKESLELYLLNDDFNSDFLISFSMFEKENEIITELQFFNGTKGCLREMEEFYRFKSILSFNKLQDIIEYLIENSYIINDLSVSDKELLLIFSLPMSVKQTNGITCKRIEIQISSYSKKLDYKIKDYLEKLLQIYYENIKKTDWFLNEQEKKLTMLKKDLINKMTIEEVFKLIKTLPLSELKKLLMLIESEEFLEIYENLFMGNAVIPPARRSKKR